MSYSFGIFPFRMAYRQNSHMHTRSQTISQANIADEYSATAENSETVGVALADPPPREWQKSAHRNAHARPWRCVRLLLRRFHGLRGAMLGAQPDVCPCVGGSR